MATLTLYGVPQSTYTRTTRMACEEKGIDYELVEVDPHSAEHKARHPFEKIPALLKAES